MTLAASAQQAPESLAFAALRYKEGRRALARKLPNVFIPYVLRDEQTGVPLVQAPTHRSWQDLMTKHERLLLWAHVEAGKTAQVSVGRVLWELGCDPSMRAVICSNTFGQAAKPVGLVSRYIEESDALHEVFPELLPGEPWTTGHLHVKGRNFSKDPSVQAVGVHGNIMGARIDLLILDDILDLENTSTPKQREELQRWVYATLFSRLTKRARVIIIGNAYHPEDLLHHLAKQSGYTALRYPVVDDNGVPRWPEQWSLERIATRRTELAGQVGEFARSMLCVARDDVSARYQRAWIDNALVRGADRTLAYALRTVPPRCKVYTGVDLGVGRKKSNDLTSLVTVLVHPNADRELLCIESGRWAADVILANIVDTHRRFHSICVVENNAAQDFIAQCAAARGVPVRPFTTGSNKAHPEFGVESLATEFANCKWIFPCRGGMHPELDALITELLYYSASAHTGDRHMALWFAREGARMGNRKVEFGNVDLQRR